MRVVVVGMGVQGHKRRRIAGDHYVACADPMFPGADYRKIEEIPLRNYDAVLACVPDGEKKDVIDFALRAGKHVLVEKPLLTSSVDEISALESLARENQCVLYTAYNHRFEPHFIRMRDLIASGVLGQIYNCRLFYGNGTASLVKASEWRDQGAGVLTDLGSHLLNAARFWFGEISADFRVVSSSRFENAAPDHVVIEGSHGPRIEMEMTLCMWRNDFSCDLIAANGSAHIRSLCKWGPSTFTHRTRERPSGRPRESAITLVEEDPTWLAEYTHFLSRIEGEIPTDLSEDRWLQLVLSGLAYEVTNL